MPSSKEVKLYKQPTKKTITIGSKKRSNKDFIKKLNIKDKIENYYPKLIYLKCYYDENFRFCFRVFLT